MTTPAVTTFEAEQAYNQPGNQFKALGGFIVTAPITVPVPAAYTSGATADLRLLDPALWTRLGLVTKSDGVTFSRDMDQEDEESWGYNEPTRTDITTDTTSAQFTLQEVKRATLEMFDFVDLSAVTPDAVTGEVTYNKPVFTAPQYRRLIYVGVDGVGTDRRYRIKIMPKGQVTGVDDEQWGQEQATRFPFTITAKVDPALGYAVRNVLGGPGQKARNAAAGFGPAA